MKAHLERIISVIFAFFLFLLSSCKMMTVISVEFPKSAKTPIPDKIQSLLLVNRIPANLFVDNMEDSLDLTFYRKSFDYDTLIYDTKSADTTLHAIGELLFESGRFDYVIPAERYLNHDTTLMIVNQMPWEQVRNLCSRYSTDAILSLDYYLTYVSASINKRHYSYNESVGTDVYYQASIKTIYSALFKIYDPESETIVTSQLLRDTLVWESNHYILKQLLLGLPTVKAALIETGIQIALKLTDQISPSWFQEKRKYFSGGKEFKLATQYINSNGWDQAMEEWKKIAGSNLSREVRSRAEFNLALGNEINGDLQQAINWGIKSYETMYHLVTYNYLLMLKKMKEKKEESAK